MTGQPIEAVRQGVKALLSDLKSDPQALETAFLSVIAFSDQAEQVVPLTELLKFQEPALEAGGTTAFGQALQLLGDCLDKEVRKSTPTQKGDWKPLVFIMTDGLPTDKWEDAAANLKAKRPGNIIGCAAGADSDPTVLKQITEIVVKLEDTKPDSLRAFFKWVSSSIKTTSQSINQPTAGAPIDIPPPPPQIQIVP
jgi:uncharacterized protein YegL